MIVKGIRESHRTRTIALTDTINSIMDHRDSTTISRRLLSRLTQTMITSGLLRGSTKAYLNSRRKIWTKQKSSMNTKSIVK